jgi:hypothetical protein
MTRNERKPRRLISHGIAELARKPAAAVAKTSNSHGWNAAMGKKRSGPIFWIAGRSL